MKAKDTKVGSKITLELRDGTPVEHEVVLAYTKGDQRIIKTDLGADLRLPLDAEVKPSNVDLMQADYAESILDRREQ